MSGWARRTIAARVQSISAWARISAGSEEMSPDTAAGVIAAVALLGAVVFLCDFSLSNFVQFATKLVR